eukprot:TRINITY_DN9392_c0_g1_i1.p1 TRINITY_DN9392_c0_g1~~TRINITY_DN9392_c0_g1_i1.p1  ORF type:complete len:555 (+),score=35.51 TRINITY_DN9392_c0_g1_i1:72-1736(+)
MAAQVSPPGDVPGAGVGSCGHNDWDHVRSAAGKAHLRCRICQGRAVLHLSTTTYRERCVPFRNTSTCPQGELCPLLHVRKDKQRLEERRAVHGDSVLAGVRREQIHDRVLAHDHDRALRMRYGSSSTAAPPSKVTKDVPQQQGDAVDWGGPPPLLEELGAVDDITNSNLPTREVAARVKEVEDIIKERRKAGLCTAAGAVVPKCIQKLNEFPQLRAPGQRQAPVDMPPDAADLSGAWCPDGRYFHPEGPPPYPKCDCSLERAMCPIVFRPCSSGRMPAVFLSQPLGPLALLTSVPDLTRLISVLQKYPSRLPQRPAAIVAITAHWTSEVCRITSSTAPPILHDYPAPIQGMLANSHNIEAAHALHYPVRGEPQLAARCAELLQAANVMATLDPVAGVGHGAWVPAAIMYPDASIPIVQVSLNASMCPIQHITIGRALAQLRNEGVLIVGSGATFALREHSEAREQQSVHCLKFDGWLRETLCSKELSVEERVRRLHGWRELGPHALECHPQGVDEFLLPLLVSFGAGAAEECAPLCDLGCMQTHLVWSCFEWVV